MVRRRLISGRLLGCLLGGLVLSVAVPWLLALATSAGWFPPPRLQSSQAVPHPTHEAALTVSRAPGRWIRSWEFQPRFLSIRKSAEPPVGPGSSTSGGSSALAHAAGEAETSTPLWIPAPDELSALAAMEHAYGWPLPALASRDALAIGPINPGRLVYERAIRVPARLVPGAESPVQLPILPIWSGLVSSALLYALALAAILSLAKRWRAARRRAAGRCGACGYQCRDAGSASCPECGTPVHPSMTRAE